MRREPGRGVKLRVQMGMEWSEKSSAAADQAGKYKDAWLTRLLYESIEGLQMSLAQIRENPCFQHGMARSHIWSVKCRLNQSPGLWMVGESDFRASEKCQCFIKRQVIRATRTLATIWRCSLSLSTDVKPGVRYLGYSTEVATLFWIGPWKFPSYLGSSLDTC